MHRIRIDVQGIVQGVGFRPFVYRLAKKYALCGSVLNNPDGVQIEIQGKRSDIDSFLNRFQSQAPPLAQITTVTINDITVNDDTAFKIIKSTAQTGRKTLISPDIATCHECLDELNSKSDRRYLYPFINCTNCGPRYTIINDIPYDRPNTTMAGFKMCPACQQEYDDPDDRRFHAQPNACPVCGPQLSLYDDRTNLLQNPIQTTIQALLAGKIIAIKGLGGYHLAVDATNEQAVQQLRERKFRFEKPLALMTSDIETAATIADLDATRKDILQNPHRPIVLCPKLEKISIAEAVSLDNDWLGIMLPYSPLHELLFTSGDLRYLVLTSANISEEPICYKDDECFERMKNIADLFLIHNREINLRCDDSVQQVHHSKPIFIRRSRGYAPRPVILPQNGTSVLAVGAHLKNTLCLTRDNLAFISQHIGDLENLQTLDVFNQTIDHLQRINEIKPGAAIYDLHPDYLSTKWVLENFTGNRYPVQHHYAHILSVMAEHGITEKVIGIALDGTGYGIDDTIWGGEILTCDVQSFTRSAWFEYRVMPGGDKAIKEPWRMAASYLLADEELGMDTCLDLFPGRSKELTIIKQMIEKDLNSPKTSSCGRLFDAVAAILGIRETVSYEGQAAILLESLAMQAKSEKNIDIGEFEILNTDRGDTLSALSIIRNLVLARLEGTVASGLSRAFHSALIKGLTEVVKIAKSKNMINKVALSGGCFQNQILSTELYNNLEKDGFEVYINREVPANDGGICLGQAYWGMHNC